MKNKKKVWIRGVEGRGEEVLNALKALGGKMNQDNPLSGEEDQWIYTITHEGFIEAWPVTSEIYKIIKDNYREIRLSEHWKDGTIVFSPKDCTFAVCSGKEVPQKDEVFVRFVLYYSDRTGVVCNCSIAKSDYRVASEDEMDYFFDCLLSLGYYFDSKTKKVVKWQGPLQHTKKQDDISDMLSSKVRDHLDIPELRFSRNKIINGDGYYWLPSDGKLHASCLGISPARVYRPSTLSSLADLRCIRSYLHCPIQLSPSEAETIRK